MKLTSLLTLLAFVCCVAVSCKKPGSSTATKTDLLTASAWKLSKMVIDTNHNQVEDAADYVVTDPAFSLQFYTNGTYASRESGVLIGSSTWQMVNNETYLKVADSSGTLFSYIYIQALTANSFVYKDTSYMNAFSAIEWGYLYR